MQPLIPTLTFEQLRQAKKNAKKSLESLGIELSSSTTGNHVAQLFGYRDWNIASALTKKSSTTESLSDKNIDDMIIKAMMDESLPKYHLIKPDQTDPNGAHSDIKFTTKQVITSAVRSSAIFGSPGVGKTLIMFSMADVLRASGAKMIYFGLKTDIDTVRREFAPLMYDISDWFKSAIVTVPISKYRFDEESAVIPVDANDDKEIYLQLLRRAIEKGHYVFIDECDYLFDLLDLLIAKKYTYYTFGMKYIREIFQHSDEAIKYFPEQLIIGRQRDFASDRYFKAVGLDVDLRTITGLNTGEFVVALKEE